MSLSFKQLLAIPCILVGLTCMDAMAREGVLSAVPADADVIAVVHNLAETSASIDELAKLVHAPPLDLLNLAKRAGGLQQGVDDQGDLALVLTIGESVPKDVLLVPVSDFAEFFAGLHVEEPTTGTLEVQIAGRPAFVGRKGDYAAIALATDRDALDQLLSAKTNLSADASLTESIAASQATVVVTSHGAKKVLSKLIDGVRQAKATFRQLPGEQGKTAADAFNLYLQLFTAAEPEVDQFSVALRIDSARTIDIVKRVHFKAGGNWAKWAAEVKPADQNLLAGLPDRPFVLAMGGVVPPGSMQHLMNYSVQVMQSQPAYKLTPEQAEQYAALSMQAMSSFRSMQMLLGVPESGAGLYSNTTAVMSFDNSQEFLAGYEKSLAAMRKLAEEVKSPMFPVPTVKRVPFGKGEAFEITMDMSKMSQFTPPGGPDTTKMMQFIMGENGTLTTYFAAADEHTVVMSYTSLENLKSAIDLYESKQPGVAGNPGVAQVAAVLPQGAQAVGFVNLSGAGNMVQQFMGMVPGTTAKAIPNIPESPPVGMAARISATGVEGHLVIVADTLRAIGDTVAAAHSAVPPQ